MAAKAETRHAAHHNNGELRCFGVAIGICVMEREDKSGA
jgi:hypothetical protein